MFPTVRTSFTNLRPDKKYWVLLDIIPCDNKRYRYAYHRSSWLVAGKADPPPQHRFYPHPDAPYTGEQLRKQVVSFEKVKLTNNEMDKTGQVRCRLSFLCARKTKNGAYLFSPGRRTAIFLLVRCLFLSPTPFECAAHAVVLIARSGSNGCSWCPGPAGFPQLLRYRE
jgi:hypothetical protein